MPVSISYFYCREKERQQNTFSSVAKALLAHILKHSSDRPGILAYLYDECLKSCKATLESQQDCIEILETVLRALPKTFIIIDGIDECETKERKAIMKFFLSAINKEGTELGKIRCLFASQELSDIKTGLQDPKILHLTEEHVKLDIQNYAVWYTSKIQERHKGIPQDAKDYIVKLVCEGSDGMFLFAKLVLKNLYAQKNLEDVYGELQPNTFPKGLEKAYDYALELLTIH
jgi:hypothetical protein